MSDSTRKHPIAGNQRRRSEQADKQAWHQRQRVAERTQLRNAMDFEAVEPVSRHAVSSREHMAKGGKHYLSTDEQETVERRHGRRRLLDFLRK